MLLGLCMGCWWWMYVGGVMYVWAFVGLLLGPSSVMPTCVSMRSDCHQAKQIAPHLGHSHHAQPHTCCCDTMLCTWSCDQLDVVIDCTHWTDNEISAEGARAVAEALKVNSSLQNLNLESKCPPLHGSPCVVCFGCCSRCWWLWRCWAWGRVCAASESVGRHRHGILGIIRCEGGVSV